MNLFKLTFLSCLMLLCLAGCSGGTPEAIAENFAEAIYSMQFEKAKKYCTPKSQEGFDMIAESSAKMMEDIQSISCKAKASSCEISEDGESATVKLNITVDVTTKKGEKDTESREVKVLLVKEDGKWLVDPKMK